MLLPLPPFSLNNLHPILVNYTAALIPASLFSDVLGKLIRRDSISRAAWWMLLYAAALTPLTALAGWWWKQSMEGGSVQILFIHQWLGFSLAASFILLAIWRGRLYARDKSPGVLYFAFAFLLLMLLVYQAHLGGSMSFG